MSEYFPNSNSLGTNVNVELDLSNCSIKTDSRNATAVDKSFLAKKTDLAFLKSDVDKLDIDELN